MISTVKFGLLTLLLCCTLGLFAQDQPYNPYQSYGTSQTTTQDVPAFQGDKVIDFFEVHNAELPSVFRQISTYSNVDIVVGDKVTGTATLSLTKKTWRQILAIVCQISNLAAVNEGNYIYVLPMDEYQKRQLDNAKNLQATQDINPLFREIVRLNNTKASEMKESIQGLLSSRGKITVVEHNNAIVIYDTKENIAQIKKMLADLDIETPQISISCKLIEVSSNAVERLGVHWGYMDLVSNFNAQHMEKQGLAAGALEKLSYGIISPQKLSLAMEYLFSDGNSEVVAQPQITTIDNKEANIFMGQQILLKSLDEAGNTVITPVNAGTALKVTPHISGEGRIMLTLSPKKESYSMVEGWPIVNQQSANTQVVVNNGETVVIAGLTSNDKQHSESGIPFLKDLPFLGHLFKKSTKSVDKRDLVIFVTPHIIERKIEMATQAQTQDIPTLPDSLGGSF